MLNDDAIFVNGLSRGGTTLLTNLIASHPGVSLVGETHHVFKGTSITDNCWQVIRKCLRYDAPIILGQVQDFFSPRLMKARKPLSRWAKRRIDWALHTEKQRVAFARLPSLHDAAEPGAEPPVTRLLAKNIDGMIYTTSAWVEMYPGATFLGLIRNGLAVCEGHVRRGRSAAEIGWRYRVLAERMLQDAAHLPRYRIVRFEDLVASPWRALELACAHCGLDVGQVGSIRVQNRRVMDAQGNHRLSGEREWEVRWLSPAEMDDYFQAAVDAHQIQRLTRRERDDFLRQAGPVMERLGYPVDPGAEPQRNVLNGHGQRSMGFGSRLTPVQLVRAA